MGSWNETCMLSSLPILDDDPVKCVILKVTDGVSYPMCFAIDGVYDDYGRCKPNEGQDEYIDYMNQYTTSEHTFDVSDALYDHEGIPLADESYGRTNRTALAMVHWDVWQVALNGASEMSHGYSGSVTQRQHLDDMFSEIGLDIHNSKATKNEAVVELSYCLADARMGYYPSCWPRPQYNPLYKSKFIEMILMMGFIYNTRREWHQNPIHGAQVTALELHKHFNDFVCKFTDHKLRQEIEENNS